MRPERWRQIDTILGAALEREPGQRDAFLSEACAGDATLRREVDSLLAAAQRTSDLETPPADVAASLVAEQSARSIPGRNIGRYVVLARVGEGGMGVVYAAYDPELDRKVAVKVLHERLGDPAELRGRLMREAQAMARLSHPNVVSVHDVGRFEDKVFVAMEFIDGWTLGEWLKEKPHSWQEALAVFRLAGKGLAAAHSAGLVHRDFKPRNVLVGKDQSVKVTDFGLAFTPGGDGTHGGLILAGTPAYMAPEQLRGEEPDARADQYSFCVALYEALTSERPPDETTLATLASQLEAEAAQSNKAMLPVPKGRGVPRWVLRPILRGLSPERSSRFENLDALLKSLEEPIGPWKRVAGALAAVAVVVSCIVGYRITVHRQSLVCRGAEAKLAGIWDLNREQAIQRAFLSTGKPYAADAFKGIQRAIEAQSNAWVEMHTEACRATRLRGEQSEALLDLRMACLRGRLEEMRALTDLFAKADTQVVEKAVEAAKALTPLQGCADASALTAQVRPPEDPVIRADVEKHRATLAEVKALKDTAQYARGLEMAQPLLGASRQTNYKPLEAEVLLMLGDLLAKTSKTKEAEEAYRLAATSADAVRDDPKRAQALTQLAFVVGYEATRMEEGLRLAQGAAAVVERLGSPPDLEAELLQVLGTIVLHQGKHDEALARLKQALEILQKTLGADDPDLANTFNALGLASKEAGRYEESIAYLEKAIQISETSLGSEHPLVANALTNLGNVLRRQGKFDAALKAEQRALAIRERVFGPEHPRVASSLMSIGLILQFQGRSPEALASHQRALEIQKKTVGPEHPDLISVLGNLALASRDLGNFEASLAYHRRALAIAEKALGPEHPTVATVWNNMAGTVYDQGNHRAAVHCLRRALAIREKVLGAQHPDLATTLQNLGYGLYQLSKQQNFEIALGYLHRAIAIQEKAAGPESPGAAGALFTLGEVESERTPRKALPHLQRALDIREKILPQGSPLIGITLERLGEAYLNLKQPLEAKLRLERASRLLEAKPGKPFELAWTRFNLARALWDTHSERERAVDLAQQARATLVKLGRAQSVNLREVNAWLSIRSGPQADSPLTAVGRAP